MSGDGYQGLPAHQQQQQHHQPPVYDQGLEVDTRAHAGLEVDPGPAAPQLAYSDDPKHVVSAQGAYYDPAHPQQQHAAGGTAFYAYKHDGGGGASTGPDGGESAAAAIPAPQGKKRRIRPLWIAVGVVAVLVVIGAVVGGVVGSRAAAAASASPADADKDEAGAGDGGNVTVPETAAALTHIRARSRLAATGWREGGTLHARLFYQGPDQQLRYSNRTGGDDDDQDAWTQPVVLDGLAYAPAVNTSLAASVSVERLKNPQWKVFFLDGTATIRNQVFNHASDNAQGDGGTFNDFNIPAAADSRLSSYWPFVLSQNRNDGALRWTRYWGVDEKHPFWENQNVTLKASAAAGLVAVPAKTRYLEAGAILYRRNDGKLFNYLAEQDGKTEGTSWESGNLDKFPIPADSALGAFTLARSSATTDNNVDTHILYQDADGTIQTVWQDDDADWKGPATYRAFDGADAGTDIACITAAAWDSSGVGVTPATDLARCFFQVKNRVREVHWNGNTWNSVGFLPIE